MSTIDHIRIAADRRGSGRSRGVTEDAGGVALRDADPIRGRSRRETGEMTAVELVEAGYGYEDIAVILQRRKTTKVPYPHAAMRAWVLTYSKGKRCRN